LFGPCTTTVIAPYALLIYGSKIDFGCILRDTSFRMIVEETAVYPEWYGEFRHGGEAVTTDAVETGDREF